VGSSTGVVAVGDELPASLGPFFAPLFRYNHAVVSGTFGNIKTRSCLIGERRTGTSKETFDCRINALPPCGMSDLKSPCSQQGDNCTGHCVEISRPPPAD